jgi:hypothetical protein
MRAPVLRGNRISLFTQSKSASSPSLMGMLKVLKRKKSDNFTGEVRMFSAGARKGALFSEGYDQQRTIRGSYYRRASAGTLPISGFKAKSNNAQFRWKGGDFEGVRKAGTWTTDGKVNVPTDQNDSVRSTFVDKTGLLKMSYRLTDPDLGLRNEVAHSVAVVQQKRDKFRGFYTSQSSYKAFDVIPNKGKSKVEPDVFVVSPSSKDVSAAASTYTISVQTSGDWTVEIPADVFWVTAEVASEGASGPSDTTVATGNGTVTVTVGQNTTFGRRKATLTVAGRQHELTQEFR